MLAAKMMYRLDPSTQGKSVAMATNLSPDLDQRTIMVTFPSLCIMCSVHVDDKVLMCEILKYLWNIIDDYGNIVVAVLLIAWHSFYI